MLKQLQQQGLTRQVLVTDRHKQINKPLREVIQPSGITTDAWHAAKADCNVHIHVAVC